MVKPCVVIRAAKLFRRPDFKKIGTSAPPLLIDRPWFGSAPRELNQPMETTSGPARQVSTAENVPFETPVTMGRASTPTASTLPTDQSAKNSCNA
jgi:hypothetical protein